MSFKEEWVEKCKKEMESKFETYRKYLIHSGFKENSIKIKIIKDASSRAAAIAGEAMVGGYGTIVLGRRGISKIFEFSMGRVTDKVIQLAQDRAVWVVS